MIRVVHEHIDLPVFAEREIGEALALRGVGDVGRRDAQSLRRSHLELVEDLAVDITGDDGCTLTQEGEADLSAEPATHT